MKQKKGQKYKKGIKMKFNMIKIIQPIGEFFLGKIEATSLKKLIEENRIVINRRENNQGNQRGLVAKRIKEISNYTNDSDATFPTPIIIALNENAIEYSESSEIAQICIKDNGEEIGEIIDGQHRINGLMNSVNIKYFQLPVVFMIGLTVEEKAYVFSIINSKQTKVDPSLIYDLFGAMDSRSPQKTCHEIARLMNKDNCAPYFGNLKMLGKKEDVNESLSQGTFVKYLMTLISRNPEQDRIDLKEGKKLLDISTLPLRKFFIEEKDEVIYKIISNAFNGLKKNYLKNWNNSILTKTVTYCAVIKSFNELYRIGNKNKDLTEDFFEKGFEGLEDIIKRGEQGKGLVDAFTSGGADNSKLSKYIIESFNERYQEE